VQQVRLELDSNVRRGSNGTALMGGSPFRVVRLSAAGSRLLDDWLAGAAVDSTLETERLRDRLIRAGIVHPLPMGDGPLQSVAFVVPVYNDAAGLAELLSALRSEFADASIVVVDDASPDGSEIAAVAFEHRAEVVRLPVNNGPAAARNVGWRRLLDPLGVSSIRPEVVVFVDADIVPTPDALRTVLAHFADETVAAVAPRVRSLAGLDKIAAYEADNSPLDLGLHPAIVFPGTRISYVPSATLAVRTATLETADGFYEGMRYGEDVDFVWRLVDEGQMVRYEPSAVVDHRNRTSLADFARQRFAYGSSAASLAGRHGEKVAPLQLPANVVSTTLAAILGGPKIRGLALLAAAAGAVPLARKLTGKVDAPIPEAARLTVMTHGYALHGLAAAATRTWAPLLLLTGRTRRALAAALIFPVLIDWLRDRPANDPVTQTAFRALDHGFYCAGVWSGVLRSRSVAALLPNVRLSQERHD
jgi:mycofactocin system glycosyltransferase